MNELPALIMAAEEFATVAHATQLRNDGKTPYITHPCAVAAKVSDLAKPVAWLHDVLEDTSATEADLRNVFPDWVVDAVVLLTRAKPRDYLDYLSKLKCSTLAREVKLADLEHNLSDLKPGNMRDKYLLARHFLEN